MLSLNFRTERRKCTACGFSLRVYKTESRSVRCVKYGEFTAIHDLMICQGDGTVFRSVSLDDMVRPYCTFANDVMIDAFSQIHRSSFHRLSESMKSWILQIDGTPDSEFSMIVVVRDSISGFVLWSGKCPSESY